MTVKKISKEISDFLNNDNTENKYSYDSTVINREVNEMLNRLKYNAKIVRSKFKKGDKLKRYSNYGTDFIIVEVNEIRHSHSGYTYVSTRGITYSENELQQ